MRRALALALLVPLVGCGEASEADVDFGGEELGPDRYAVLSEDGEVKMGLTDQYLYFALSERTREQARQEMREAAEKEGVSGLIGGVVQKTVGRAIDFRARYAVSEIRDVRWENGRMRILFEDPDRSLGEEFKVSDRPVGEAFPQAAVEAFAEEFRRVKAEQPASPAGDAPPDTAAAGAGREW